MVVHLRNTKIPHRFLVEEQYASLKKMMSFIT
ncbi:hypothetical protein RDI58_010473 [Solanum bulbocastanum]|uniref:Uncharacterized protein n=1 Tax=Solanum bulbocastanum TaxID=147425 RepID=A0AAN8TUE7_SOLBU